MSPLGPLQKAMLAATTGRLIQVEIRVTADGARVEAAWREVVRRIPVLRLVLGVDDTGEPVFHETVAIGESLPLEKDTDQPVCSVLERDRREGFPADGRSLRWRATWLAGPGVVVLTVDHALLDGRSLARVLAAFLDAVEGRPVKEMGYRGWMPPDAAARAAAMAHGQKWMEEANPEPPVLPPGSGGRASRTLGRERREQLEQVAVRLRLTPATILIWAWGQVMAHATGHGKILVGQVRAGPPRPGEAGFFMNTLPVSIARGGSAPWQESAALLREQLLDLRTVEAVPPGWLSAGGQAAWTSVIMVEKGTMAEMMRLSGAEGAGEVVVHEQPGPELLATAYLSPELRLEVENDATAPFALDALVAHWETVVLAMLDTPGAAGVAVVGLSAAMNQTLDAWENPLPDPGDRRRHLAADWQAAARNFADGIALSASGESWTYRELDTRMHHLAGRLIGAGVKPGDRVAVALGGDQRPWIVALLACSRIGAIYCPLDGKLPDEVKTAILQAARPSVLITDRPVGISGPWFVMDPQDGSEPGELPMIPDDGLAPLALLFTSGTTGKPKGVVVHHDGVVNEVLWVAEAMGMAPGDRLLQFASPGFDAALEEILACLMVGATLVVREPEPTEGFADFHQRVADEQITILDLPTSFWSAWSAWMAQENRRVPASVRESIIGGERASGAAWEAWQIAGGGRLWNGYGPTEASIIASAHLLEPGVDEAGDPPIGKPLAGCRLRVVDPDGKRLAPGLVGELWIGGRAVGPGYWDAPELTAAAFVEADGGRWFRSGDLVCWDERGRLHYRGRADHQVKILGHRVEPEGVARRIEEFPGVAAAHVAAVPDGDRLHLAAWVQWREASPPDWPGALRHHLVRHLAVVAIPTHWVEVAGFQLTPRGKIDRAALPDPFAATGATVAEFATETETELAAIWSEVLGLAVTDRHQWFLNAGGSSLAAMRMFASISRRWGVHLPMATLLENPDVASLAAAIDRVCQSSAKTAGPAKPHVASFAERPPGVPIIFGLHGGDGGVFFFRPLAARLAPDVVLMAVEAPGITSDHPDRLPTDIRTTATTYLESVRAHQAEGPYHLLGYSFGGVLAYEMARQLREQGESVALVGILDTANPAVAWRRYSARERLGVFLQSRKGQGKFRVALAVVARVARGIFTNLKTRAEDRLGALPVRSRPHGWLRALQIRRLHGQAMDAYVPLPLDVPMLLITSGEPDDKFAVAADYGWGKLVPELRIKSVPGGHLTMMQESNAADLARAILPLAGRVRETSPGV